MTSIITVRTTNEIVLLSDGLCRSPQGKTVSATKCALMPGAPALVACRGAILLASLFANDAREHTFDGLITEGPKIVRNFTAILEKQLGLGWTHQEEMYLAGWSDKESRLAIFHMVMDDRYIERDQIPYVWHELKDDVTMAPPPATEAGYHFPWGRKFDPAVDGLAMMEAQRLTRGCADLIGGWIQAAKVTADGMVSSQIIRPAEWRVH